MMRLGSSDSTRHIGARYDVHFCYTYRHEYETKRTTSSTSKLHIVTTRRLNRTATVYIAEKKNVKHTNTHTHIWCVTFVRIANMSRVERD